MSPLKRLFGSRSRQPTLEEQIEALEGQPEADLLALVQSDAQEALREAALNYLSYNQTLLNLALNDNSGRLQQAARKRIGQMLEAEHLTLEELTKTVADQSQLLSLSSYSARAGQQVLDQISEPELLLELAINGASIQIRRAAAERISTRRELEQLYKSAQGRDKTVYKLAKTRLEAFKAEDARRAESEAQALVLCEKLEQLARVEQDPLRQAKLDKLAQDWAALTVEPPEATAQRYQQALQQLRDQEAAEREAEAQVLAEEQAREAEKTRAQERLQEAEAQTQALLRALYEADNDTLASETFPAQLEALGQALAALNENQQARLQRQRERAQQLLEQLRERGSVSHWLEQLKRADTDESKAAARQQLQPLLKGARNALSEPHPASVSAALEELKEIEEAEKAVEHTERKRVRELEGLTRQGLGAVQRGQVRRARGLHRATLEKREGIEHLSNHLAGKLAELDEAIERLSDWHEFAVTPKKETLIRAMTELENSTLPPDELARKIHQLQDDWREVSKGVPHHDESLWHQFQEASHKAFGPCKEFFETQAREREAHQAKRDTLIEQLEQYLEGYDWDHPVWKDVEHTLKQARREWRDAWPVPRQSIKEQEARFEPLMDQLHGKLSEAYEAHRAAKEALVARARELTEQSDLHQAIEGAKQLQAQWKTVGQCRPRDDQALWKQFRQHCDAIFERRQEQFQAADQERNAHAEEAERIIQQLRGLLDNGPESAGALRTRTSELKAAFHNLGELPRQRIQAINDEFHKALKALDHRQAEVRHQARARQEQQLLNAAEAVRALELASLENSGTTAAREEADIALQAVEQWPGDSRARLEQRLEEAGQLSAEQQQQNLEALHLLCIRAEILTERETPAEDKSRRMNYQIQQLQQGLGQQEDSRDGLLLEWLRLGGVSDPDYSRLLTRFLANWKMS